MPSIFLTFIIQLAPIIGLISVMPVLCQSAKNPNNGGEFYLRDNLSNGRAFHEMQFNLNFSYVWSGTSRSISPRLNIGRKESTLKGFSQAKPNIYKKTEELISEITRLIPDVKVNGLLDIKRQRKNQKLQKRLQIGIYHRHNFNTESDFNYSLRDGHQLESNTSDSSQIIVSLNTTLGIDENRSQPINNDNSTDKSTDIMRSYEDEIIDQFRLKWPVHLWLEQDFSSFNEHWLKFSPPSPAAHYILAALYAVIMMFGVSGNAFAIYMFLRCRSLRTPANILVMNLAVSDLLLLSKMPIFIYNSIYLGPALGNFACQVYGFMGGMTGTVSIVTLASIAADRYNVVAEPFRRTTYARARVTVALTWVYGATFAGLPLMIPSLGRYKPEGYLTSCSFDYLTSEPLVKAFILCFFVGAWVLPFCLISFCYIGIIRVVIAARHMNIGDQVIETSNKHCREEEKRKTELRLAFVVIGIIAMWFVAWSPYAVVALLGVSGQSHLITPLISMVPALFCKTASCLDPYVYAVSLPRFRNELRHLTKRSRRKRSAKQWSPQHRSRVGPPPRIFQGPDGIENGVEEEIQCLGSVEIISMASRRSMSRDTTNYSSSIRTASCSFNPPRGDLALY